MADNPYAARPKSDKAADKCPPDMPRGDSPADKAARARYWIDRGNAHLAETGKGHLHWCHANGNYWIEPR